MAVLLHVPLPVSTHHSPQFSVRSKGWPSIAWKARTRNPAQIRRRSPFPILCSVEGNRTATVPVPAQVVLGRSSFPPGFTFGAASSAYQVEGAWNEGGRGPSIWDTFTHEQNDKILDNSNGDVATDSYHRYKEDVKIMKDMGLDTYRFSISWSRILPDGTLKGGVNQEGIAYYNNLINELIDNGITPFVTLFHWDVPQALEDKYGGFLDHRIVDDFKDYAKICFSEFGDRVKYWITLNEPWSLSICGYCLGWHAPGRCTKEIGCPVGNSITEPYIVAHNLILAHAAAAKLYKEHFQATQKGEVGITLVSMWHKPYSESYDDKAAAIRAMDFMLGWFMDPLLYGDYPCNMRDLVGKRLPHFKEAEKDMIKGSYDFIGLNYYTSKYARALPLCEPNEIMTTFDDMRVELLVSKDGDDIGDLHGSWIYVVPDGIRELLVYMKEKYNNPKIYITENGTCELDDPELTLEQAREDPDRIEYFSLHLAQVRAAIQGGGNVKGYFAWSLTDNFEWQNGYIERFGLNYIDYDHDLNRYPKASAEWYTRFLKS